MHGPMNVKYKTVCFLFQEEQRDEGELYTVRQTQHGLEY